MSALLRHSYRGKVIQQRAVDGWVNLTSAKWARHKSMDPEAWAVSKDVAWQLEAIAAVLLLSPDALFEISNGGATPPGLWMHLGAGLLYFRDNGLGQWAATHLLGQDVPLEEVYLLASMVDYRIELPAIVG